jgi:hypothetical protein
MRYYIIILLLLFASCKQKKKTTDQPAERSSQDTATTTQKPAIPTVDTSLYFMSDSVLTALRKSDYARLARYAHPIRGIRFSPYGYVDTISDRVLFDKQIRDAAGHKAVFNWGEFDGTGDPIVMTLPDYFKRFVYDADYLHAQQRSLNHFIGGGNSLNNLTAIYPGCEFTEHYFPGFDPKYEGMDWRTVRLVYKREGAVVYLVGIIHDEWTT